MSSNSSGKKLEGFFTGKGFYIVLFLCAAVIGVSAWMMAAGDVAMKNEVPVRSNVNMENKRVETVIIPAETAAPAAEAPVFGEAEPVTGGDEEIAAEAPEISAEGINAPSASRRISKPSMSGKRATSWRSRLPCMSGR